MIYVLDTNVLSALMRGDERALGHLERVGRPSVRLPQPVLAEIAYGIARLPRSRRKTELTTVYAALSTEFARAEWTDDVSACFGEQKALLEKRGALIEDFDLAIAAHALAVGGRLVTANARHMKRLPGVEIEDWLS